MSTTEPKEIEFYEDLAWRLRLAVEALDIPKGEIAASIGVSQSRFSNWITGQNKPDWFAVTKLCRRYGISLDWICLGEVAGLRHSLAANLERAAAEKSERPRVRAHRAA